MPGNPKVIKYWGGRFRICKENLPISIQTDSELQTKVLVLLYNQFAYKEWGSTLPIDKFEEMNDYAYNLFQPYWS